MSSSSASVLLWKASKTVLTFVAITGGFAGLYWYGQSYDIEVSKKYLDNNRNYAMLPFDMLDAQDICEFKTRVRYGEDLVRTQIDYHSTRFEENSGLYKVFLSAYVGDARIYEESLVHCFVNPDEYMIEHFRVFKKDSKSLMARAKSFLNFK